MVENASNTLRSLKAFLCHSSADKPMVRELYRRLLDDGVSPWLDEEELLPGQDWRDEIPKAVRTADVVLVCLSRGSINREGYLQKELKTAIDVSDERPEGSIFVIPVKLEECEIPDRLSRWHWVNYFEPGGYERLRRALQARATSCGLAAIAFSSERFTVEEGKDKNYQFPEKLSGDDQYLYDFEVSNVILGGGAVKFRLAVNKYAVGTVVAIFEGDHYLALRNSMKIPKIHAELRLVEITQTGATFTAIQRG